MRGQPGVRLVGLSVLRRVSALDSPPGFSALRFRSVGSENKPRAFPEEAGDGGKLGARDTTFRDGAGGSEHGEVR